MEDPDKSRGFYNKYYVERLNDDSGKHDDCRYFVLDLNHDRHAIPALKAYIDSCRDDYHDLAQDLERLLYIYDHG